jgi:hypothetical protein
MFTRQDVMVDAPFEVAAGRLARLITRGALRGVSDVAYEGGIEVLLRVGPFGGTRGLSKLVRVRALEPVYRESVMTVSLRWEATGIAGDLYPVLDADVVLAREAENWSRLRLIGAYRPPFGRAGAALDRAIMGRVATATIRSLVEGLAAAIADPALDAPPHAESEPHWQRLPELSTP